MARLAAEYLKLRGQLSASSGMVGYPYPIHRPRIHRSDERASAKIFARFDGLQYHWTGGSRAALRNCLARSAGFVLDGLHFDGARTALDR